MKQIVEENKDRYFNDRVGENWIKTGFANLDDCFGGLEGGDVTARNREDGTSGACFIIELPLGKKHLKNNQIYSDNGETKKKQQRFRARQKTWELS